MIHTILINKYKIIISVIVVVVAVLYQDNLQYYYSKYIKAKSYVKTGTAFTEEILAQYNGVTEKKLYISVLGVVYDVSKGKQHYAKGSPYHYFVGKDGSRALITGDFKDESKNKDHVLDLTCNDFLSLLKWRESLESKYKKVGVLAGRYYENDGKITSYMVEFNDRIKICHDEKESDRKKDLLYPPCNIAWSQDEGTKVWCTNNSGGVTRNWIGVPRQLYTPGEKVPKCICINIEQELDASMKLKEYENCSNTSTVCFVRPG